MILHLTMNPPIMILMMITIMIAVQEVLVLSGFDSGSFDYGSSYESSLEHAEIINID